MLFAEGGMAESERVRSARAEAKAQAQNLLPGTGLFAL